MSSLIVLVLNYSFDLHLVISIAELNNILSVSTVHGLLGSVSFQISNVMDIAKNNDSLNMILSDTFCCLFTNCYCGALCVQT